MKVDRKRISCKGGGGSLEKDKKGMEKQEEVEVEE